MTDEVVFFSLAHCLSCREVFQEGSEGCGLTAPGTAGSQKAKRSCILILPSGA